MPDYSDEIDDIVAAASIPDCDNLAIAYRSTEAKRDDSDRWEFRCSRCGTGFAMPESELVFQCLPKEWLLARVYAV